VSHGNYLLLPCIQAAMLGNSSFHLPQVGRRSLCKTWWYCSFLVLLL
jgi:hypothetical protein